MLRDLGARTPPLRHVGDRFPVPCKHTSWRPARVASLDRGLNAALLSCAAVKSPSSPVLPHANSTQGAQAPPMTSSGLCLGLNLAGSSRARADRVTTKLLGEGARCPEVNSPARPRGGFYDNATQLYFNGPWWTATHERTSQQPSTVTLIPFPFLPLPLRL
jgi:hypothetical protein